MKYRSSRLGTGLPDKHESAALAPNPAARELIERLDEAGIETLLDRFEAQQPQCGHGLHGVCCRMCQWGPCSITDKSPRGVCGRDLELVVVANLVRAAAAGTSAQTMHARELILTLRAIARGEIALEVRSPNRLREVAGGLNVSTPWTPADQFADLVSSAMLEDLSRLTDDKMRAMGFAPRERREAWERLGILPRSAGYEVLESLHMTTLGGCSDWRELLNQGLRTSIAYAYSGLVASSVLSDILFGVPEPTTAQVNFGVLKAGQVNILVHGHSAVMLEKILEVVGREDVVAEAQEAGAEGIVVAGMCCTGHESLARHGIPTVTGAMGQELAIGTGAVDAVVVDMQCVIPGIAHVAECFGTRIVTTCRSNRIPGAAHIPFDPEHPQTLEADARRVVAEAIEAFCMRDRSKIAIPDHTTTVMSGFTRESIFEAFGLRRLIASMRDGKIRGIVAMVGCSTPKVGYENAHVTIARSLIEQGVLVLASGCAGHALLNAGLCSVDAAQYASDGLREECETAGVPPVLAVGGCADNARIIQIFAMIANQVDEPLPQMPFMVSGPELANEKTIGQMLGVLAHGISVAVGMTPNLPFAVTPDLVSPELGTSERSVRDAAAELADFFGCGGLEEILGSRLLVEPDPARSAERIVAHLDRKRDALEW